MNVTGIEQAQGPLAQVANALSAASKPAIAVQTPTKGDDEKATTDPLSTGAPGTQPDRVEISKAAQALSDSQFSSQQGNQQQGSSLTDR